MAARLRHRLREPKRTPAPFVVGVNRSGTTLLRMMLDAHPELAIPPETHFVPEVSAHPGMLIVNVPTGASTKGWVGKSQRSAPGAPPEFA